MGYLVVLFLFGSLMYTISQDLKPGADPVYEVVRPNSLKVQTGLEGAAKPNGVRAPPKAEKPVVVEAPKGGIANEAAVVGNEDVAAKKKFKGKDAHVGYKAKIIESEDKGMKGASMPEPMPKKAKMSVDDIIEDSEEKKPQMVVSKKDLEESDEYYVAHVHD